MFDSVLKISIFVKKIYVLRNISGFAQNAFRFMRKNSQKNISASCAKIAQKFFKKMLHENSSNFTQKIGKPICMPINVNILKLIIRLYFVTF